MLRILKLLFSFIHSYRLFCHPSDRTENQSTVFIGTNETTFLGLIFLIILFIFFILVTTDELLEKTLLLKYPG